MVDITPRTPMRPLIWPDNFLDMADWLLTFDTPIYVVGGAVRDAYLHRPVYDIDLAVDGDAIYIARQVTNHFNGDIFIMDRERGVARVSIAIKGETLVLDFARFRGDDLLSDLQDRDFTINAMAVSIRDLGQMIDPLNGEEDLKTKQLRRCGEQSISDDPIRALRAIRQSVQLGLRIESETLADIKSHAPKLKQISNERIRDEFFKLLMLKNPSAALRVAMATNLLTYIVPEVAPLVGYSQPTPHVYDVWQHTLVVIEKMTRIIEAIGPRRTDHTAANFDMGMLIIQLDRFRGALYAHLQRAWPDGRSHSALLLLAILLHNIGKPLVNSSQADHSILALPLVKTRATELRLSRGEVERLTIIIEHYHKFFALSDYQPLTLHRFWFALGDAGVDVCLVAVADYLGVWGTHLAQDEWLKIVERITILLDAFFNHYDTIVNPPLLVDGDTFIQQFNLKPGPIIKALLTQVREAQVMGQVRSVDEAIQLARNYLNAHQS